MARLSIIKEKIGVQTICDISHFKILITYIEKQKHHNVSQTKFVSE